MAVKIRLKRAGMPKQPNYRIVVMDSRKPRDGAAVANLGHYAPYKLNKPLFVDLELYQEWINKGAKPTDAVRKLVKQFMKRGETVEAVVKPKAAKKAEAPKAEPEPEGEVQPEEEPPAEEEPEVQATEPEGGND